MFKRIKQYINIKIFKKEPCIQSCIHAYNNYNTCRLDIKLIALNMNKVK